MTISQKTVNWFDLSECASERGRQGQSLKKVLKHLHPVSSEISAILSSVNWSEDLEFPIFENLF